MKNSELSPGRFWHLNWKTVKQAGEIEMDVNQEKELLWLRDDASTEASPRSGNTIDLSPAK